MITKCITNGYFLLFDGNGFSNLSRQADIKVFPYSSNILNQFRAIALASLLCMGICVLTKSPLIIESARQTLTSGKQ